MNREPEALGVLLVGGNGSRLWPSSLSCSKQLMPIFNKPLFYYPLSQLMLAGIRNIALICRPGDEDQYRSYFGDGEALGLCLNYLTQEAPKGLAHALGLSESLSKGRRVVMALGDNIFYGDGLEKRMVALANGNSEGSILGTWVSDPSQYGVLKMDETGRVSGVIEKPQQFVSHYIVPGVYAYNSSVFDRIKGLNPSDRGEFEITDINNQLAHEGVLDVEIMGRGMAWFDTGNAHDMLEAGEFIAAIEKKQGRLIGSPEEVALRKKWISVESLLTTLGGRKSDYANRLRILVNEI
jgi:glucose-1-phosphate thymidylyltransferase